MKYLLLILSLFVLFSCKRKKGRTKEVIGAVYKNNGLYLIGGPVLKIVKDTLNEDGDKISDTSYYPYYLDSLRDANKKAKYDSVNKTWLGQFITSSPLKPNEVHELSDLKYQFK